MKDTIITGSLIDVMSFMAEIAILLWFFMPMQSKRETSGKRTRQAAAYLPLIILLGIYMTPLNAAVSVFSIENLGIQLLRMLLHLMPVMWWLMLSKECSSAVAVYLSGLFTAIYLTAQNLRMVMMTYGSVTPPHVTRGLGYIVGLLIVAATEFFLAAATRRMIRPEQIDTIDGQRKIMMSVMLLVMVYFKWILTAVRELSLGGDRIMMISFSLVTSLGLYLVMLLYDYSRYLLKMKQIAERESTVLQYEVRSAKREMQASDDIRRLYHDVKNHLLAIQSMSGSESEVNEYLNELLPKFEGYETQVSTGNEVVDAILSEKIQLAYPDDIRFNVCLDLSELDAVKAVDLVTIFGNAVDNAIEALRNVSEDSGRESRYIFIKSSRFANNIIIRFQNRFEGKVNMSSGDPVTSKKDAAMHGIGISSIRNAVSRYGGNVSVKADNKERQFTLTVMLPTSKIN